MISDVWKIYEKLSLGPRRNVPPRGKLTTGQLFRVDRHFGNIVIKKPAHADWLENIGRQASPYAPVWGFAYVSGLGTVGLGNSARLGDSRTKLWRKKKGNVNRRLFDRSQKAFMMPIAEGNMMAGGDVTMPNSIASAQTKGETRTEVRTTRSWCICCYVWTSDVHSSSWCHGSCFVRKAIVLTQIVVKISPALLTFAATQKIHRDPIPNIGSRKKPERCRRMTLLSSGRAAGITTTSTSSNTTTNSSPSCSGGSVNSVSSSEKSIGYLTPVDSHPSNERLHRR